MYPDYPDPMPAFAYIGQQGRAQLESALAEPGQGFGGRYHHRYMPDKAAVLLRSIIKNHPLVDGNKRLALTATLVFFTLNSWVFLVARREAVDKCLEIAKTKGNVDVKEIATWMRRRALPMNRISAMGPEALFSKLDKLGYDASDRASITPQLEGIAGFLRRNSAGLAREYRAANPKR